MNVKAIFMAMGIAWLAMGLTWVLASIPGWDSPNPPQLLIIFSLWLIPGYFAGAHAASAGALHGLVSGMLGMLAVVLGVRLAVGGQWMAEPELFTNSSSILVVLSGFWAAAGGMVADTVRVIKAKRAARRSTHRG